MKGFAAGAELILVNEAHDRTRQEAGIAHELAEIALLEKRRADHELFCDRVAAGVLLPKREFLVALYARGWEIPSLKVDFPWASCESLALRAADLLPDVHAAKWVDGRPRWRSGWTLDRMTAAERLAARMALESPRGLCAREDVLAVAWRLPEWERRQRVISVCLPAHA